MNPGSPACCRYRNSPQLPVWRSSLTWWQHDPELDGPGNMVAGCGSAAKLPHQLYPHNRCLHADWQTTWTHGSVYLYITYHTSNNRFVIMIWMVSGFVVYIGGYLCRGHDGDSSNDFCPVGDLLFGSNNIRQSFLVFCILLPIWRFWHL